MRPRLPAPSRLLQAYGLSVSFWLITAVLVSSQVYRERLQEQLPAVYSDLLLLYAVRYLTVALLTPALFYGVMRWPLTGVSLRRIGLYVLGYPAFCLAFAVVRWLLLPPWMHETLSWGPRSFNTLLRLGYDTFADLFLLYLGILSAAHAYAYFARSKQQEVEGLEMRQSLVQSELQALRAQLHPHFLFNTLQGISTLIDTDPAVAKNLLFSLADLLRTVIKYKSADLVPFSDELSFLRAYLELEQIRFGRRLEVQWQVPADTESVLSPQLLLQPLVENALVHGIAPARQGGWLRIEAELRGERLRVVVSNSVAGTSEPGFGLGIPNVRQRLKYLYGDDAHLSFELDQRRAVARAALDVPAFAVAPGFAAPRVATSAAGA
ncbi:MAG: histidine kinase [Gammaproteobacteria bacterium]|nr:histidine kinase [Gammaproteobacteria bacterium]MBV9620957.1 histidine kinase [Gammaproteobacteria bacterium]